MRICKRAGCHEPACRPSGSATWMKLCKAHNAKRRENQAHSKLQPNCKCGGKLPMPPAIQCRGCDWNEEQRLRGLYSLEAELWSIQIRRTLDQ